MRKQTFLMALVILILFPVLVAQAVSSWESIGREHLDLKTVWVDPVDPRVIFIGPKGGVFKTQDAGKNWRSILSARGINKSIYQLLSVPPEKDSLYAATGAGLFYSPDSGKNWKKIFKGKDYLENECVAVAVLPPVIYLGTKGGFFISKDSGRLWHGLEGELGKSGVLAIAYNFKDPEYIYIACASGVFRINSSTGCSDKIFAALVDDGESDEITDEDADTQAQDSIIRHIAVDPNNSRHLYLATLKGIYESYNAGGSWSMLSDYGLLNRQVEFLLVSGDSDLYAVNESGIFIYKQNYWHELSLDFVSARVESLALDRAGNLYAACDKGLFRAKISQIINDKRAEIMAEHYEDDPGISGVQAAAIKYAEVEPEKVLRWRKQAAKKALLPQVSVGVDRNTTDLWHWEGGSTTKSDDDTLRRGRDNLDWDVTLSWDLSELIWNSDQISIDTRSRLVVQLRDDILDEVTKTYFERLRVKMEMNNLSIEDRQKRLDKELKLRELTAMLDGLTGGYFSSELPVTQK
ncbi:MAG: hypothetical protein PHG40_02430 [Candidatus Omnitrophica bacterium]|nr:hypothetical protein [Candidatus Omnitrophota bacterium]